jgi:transcriptional regulator with XRE-family HTH domain
VSRSKTVTADSCNVVPRDEREPAFVEFAPGTSEVRQTTMMTLSEVVRRFRSEARLSQEELAERAGLSSRTVSNIETGVATSPRAITLSLLSEALGLDADKKRRLFEVAQPCERPPIANDGRSLGEVLEPFGRPVRLDAGQRLFARGAPGDTMYLIQSGTLHLAEFGADLGPGSFVGEIALFSPDGKRTQTVAALSEVCLLELCRDDLPALHRRYPEFSAHLLRLVTSRLLENTAQLRARADGLDLSQSPAA